MLNEPLIADGTRVDGEEVRVLLGRPGVADGPTVVGGETLDAVQLDRTPDRCPRPAPGSRPIRSTARSPCGGLRRCRRSSIRRRRNWTPTRSSLPGEPRRPLRARSGAGLGVIDHETPFQFSISAADGLSVTAHTDNSPDRPAVRSADATDVEEAAAGAGRQGRLRTQRPTRAVPDLDERRVRRRSS